MAIVVVMLFHFYSLLEIGWIGVQLFFVLSGYLITTILMEEKSNNFSFYIKRFYWRRSLRIFPLYYFYLLLVSVGYVIFSVPSSFLNVIPFLLTYTYNYVPLFAGLNFDAFFPHFWSLSVEEQFYLFWPLLIFVFSKNGLRFVLLLILVLSPIFRYCIGVHYANDYSNTIELGEIIYRLLPSQIDAFAYGALIPIFHLNKFKWNWNLIVLVVLISFVVIGLFNYFTFSLDFSPSISSLGFPIGSMQNSAHVWSYSLIDITCLVLIIWTLQAKSSNIFVRILSSKLMVSIGKVSYGMYVYHWIIIFILRKYFILDSYFELIPVFILYTLTTYLVSWLSFEYFEKVFLRWKNKKYKTQP